MLQSKLNYTETDYLTNKIYKCEKSVKKKCAFVVLDACQKMMTNQNSTYQCQHFN